MVDAGWRRSRPRLAVGGLCVGVAAPRSAAICGARSMPSRPSPELVRSAGTAGTDLRGHRALDCGGRRPFSDSVSYADASRTPSTVSSRDHLVVRGTLDA